MKSPGLAFARPATDRGRSLQLLQHLSLFTTPRLSYWNYSSSVALFPIKLLKFTSEFQYMSFYVPPSQQRTLRACMVCSLVQLHSVSDPSHPRGVEADAVVIL